MGGKITEKKSSRRQYIHPFKPGKVTISEHSGRDFPIKTTLKQGEGAGPLPKDI